MASKLFGGISLTDVVKEVQLKGEPTPYDSSPTRPRVPAAELALSGRISPAVERVNIILADPARCKPWAFHNRTSSWYTPERCKDLIDSFVKDGQIEPALARRLKDTDQFDYELIYGMRRRYAAEVTQSKLKLHVVDIDDARAAVMMHAENADRQDITPMERGLSFLQQLDGKVFDSQDALATAVGLSKGQIAKMLKAAQFVKHATIAKLFSDKSAVPVSPAYELAVLMDTPGAREIVLKAAENWLTKGVASRSPSGVIKHLKGSLDRTKRMAPFKAKYSLSPSTVMTVDRKPSGKVTLSFPKGSAGFGSGDAADSGGEGVEGAGMSRSFLRKLNYVSELIDKS